MSDLPASVRVVEVGPRDRLQNEPGAVSSETKIAFVHDLVIHPRDDVVVIATHGHGMYALDARPIQGEVEEEAAEESDEPWGDEPEEDD